MNLKKKEKNENLGKLKRKLPKTLMENLLNLKKCFENLGKLKKNLLKLDRKFDEP